MNSEARMIELQPFGRTDFARLIGWAVSPEFVLQWAGSGFVYPLDEEQLHEYVRGAETDPPFRTIYKAVDTDRGVVVGHIELNNINYLHKFATVSRVLVGDPSSRGKGVGEQMMQRVMRIGFEELELHRLELVVFDFNEAAIRLYEKVGFVKEGRIREARRLGDQYWNHYVMGILEDEWRGRNGAQAIIFPTSGKG
jgi:RimJ/RimL family protein N-acetyltransferase